MKVGVAGQGAFGVKHIEAMKNIPGIDVITLTGGNQTATEEVAKKFGIPHWTGDLGESLKQPDLEAMILATPTQMHAKQAEQPTPDHGADATINYATEDLRDRIKALTDSKGADVVYDPVGGSYTEPALRSIAWRGRLLVVGFAAGEIPKIPLNLTLLKGCSIVGVFWGEFARREPDRFAASMRQLGEWHREGKIAPHISATFPLERAADALTQMAERKVIGKVVLIADS